MRKFLFLAVLGCTIAYGLGQNHEFTDTAGRCWSCSAGNCQPCTQQWISNNGWNPFVPLPPDYPTSCPTPDCTQVGNRPVLFPVNGDPRRFYQCAEGPNGWAPVQMDCQCGTFFDAELGSCQFPWDWLPWCDFLPNPLPDPIPCEDTTTPPPDTTEPPTTEVATTAAPAPCVPCCMPCMIWWMCPPCQQTSCNNGCAAMG